MTNGREHDTMCVSPPILLSYVVLTNRAVLVVPHHIRYGFDVHRHAPRRLEGSPDNTGLGGWGRARLRYLHRAVGDGDVDACSIELDLHCAVRMEPACASRDA